MTLAVDMPLQFPVGLALEDYVQQPYLGLS
jgi:hypothetical protein